MSKLDGISCVHLISTGGLYGAERAMLELCAYLRSVGVQAQVIVLEGAGGPAVAEKAMEVGVPAEVIGGRRLGFVSMGRQLRARLDRLTPGIVHSHGYKPDLLLTSMPSSRDWTRVATCHTWYSDTWRMKLWEYLDKKALRGFDRVAVVSDFLKDDLLRSGFDRARLDVVSNGISPPPLQQARGALLRKELSVDSGDGLILQIGRLTRSKRNAWLIDAIADRPELSRAHVAFVGDGEDRLALEQRSIARGVAQRTHFLGYRSDATEFLGVASVLAISSDHEGLPIVLLEAMACSCPIVSTDVGAITAAVQDGVSAWVVSPNDYAGFAEALTQAVSSPKEAHRRAWVAHAAFQDRYSRSAMGEQYVRFYSRATAQKDGSAR